MFNKQAQRKNDAYLPRKIYSCGCDAAIYALFGTTQVISSLGVTAQELRAVIRRVGVCVKAPA